MVTESISESAVITQFSNENNTITSALYFLYGSQPCIEFEVVLEVIDSSKSNPI